MIGAGISNANTTEATTKHTYNMATMKMYE